MELDHTDKWGRLGTLRGTWREFNERSVDGAHDNLGDLLPLEDYYRVKNLIDNLSSQSDKYLLHGDTGVHNFVFHNISLTGVIDPSPMVGHLLRKSLCSYIAGWGFAPKSIRMIGMII